MLKSRIVVLIAGLVAAAPVVAQEYPFHRLSQRDGLTSNFVSGIAQDSIGFIWVGSWDGLSRYDGTSFRQYYDDVTDSTSVPAGGTRRVCVDRHGGLWVGSRLGISRFDYAADSFVRYLQDQETGQCYRDHTGVLWVELRGEMAHYDEASDAFVAYPYDSTSSNPLLTNAANYVGPDRDGSLWVSSFEWIKHFRPDGSIRTYTYPPGGGPLPAYRLTRRNDGLWYFLDGRLYRLDIESGDIEEIDLHGFDTGPGFVPGLYVDRFERVWLTDHTSITMLDPAATGAGLRRFSHESDNPNSPFRSTFVLGLFEDRYENVWALRFPHGLNLFEPNVTRFQTATTDLGQGRSLPNADVLGVFEDPTGKVWIGSRPGLSTLDPETGSIEILIEGSDSFLGHPFPWDIATAPDGTMWFALGNPGNGLVASLNPETREVEQYGHDPDDPESLGGRWPVALRFDANGDLWIGMTSGLDVLRGGKPPFIHVPLDDGASATDIEIASDGTVWAAASQSGYGVSRVDPADLSVIMFESDPADRSTLAPGAANDLTIDAHGAVWVVTDGGLSRIDPESHDVERVTLSHGGRTIDRMPAIQADFGGHLWLGARIGLVKYTIETGQTVVYGEDRGIAEGGFSFGSHRGPSGRIYMPGPSGLTYVDPNRIIDNEQPPDVTLTGARVMDADVLPGPGSPLAASAVVADRISLTYDQNVVGIEYSALHFAGAGEGNRYLVRLDGFDRDWRDVGPATTATYTNLAPGAYRFHVRARSRDGVWSVGAASIDVVVSPPWWRTNLAYALYALLFLAASFGLARVQRRRLIRRERERALEKEVEQARELERAYGQLEEAHDDLKNAQEQLIHSEKLASLGQLTAGIAHEIKNPLNFVNNFASVARELIVELRAEMSSGGSVEPILDDLDMTTSKIAEHGTRADNIVRGMLQHSRGSTGERIRTDVNELVRECVNLSYHGCRASRPDFNADIVTNLDPDAGTVELVPEEISRVLVNLCNNAFYAVGRRQGEEGFEPKVTVSTKRRDGLFVVTVEDNGPGIASDALDRLFEPFFTTKPTGEGTGLGLSLSYDIVTKGHGGMLRAGNRESGGARFEVELPVTG